MSCSHHLNTCNSKSRTLHVCTTIDIHLLRTRSSYNWTLFDCCKSQLCMSLFDSRTRLHNSQLYSNWGMPLGCLRKLYCSEDFLGKILRACDWKNHFLIQRKDRFHKKSCSFHTWLYSILKMYKILSSGQRPLNKCLRCSSLLHLCKGMMILLSQKF